MERLQARNPTEALVLATIRRLAPVTRVEIARHADLAPATVSQVVASLLELGVVEELGRRVPRRGQPPIELGIRARAAFTLGVHLGHGSVAAVLADLDGTVLARREQEIAALEPGPVLEQLVALCDELRTGSHFPAERLLGVGLACFGPLDLEAGTVNATPFAPSWKRVPLRQQLADATGLPVFLDNNATAAAIGEHWYGAAQGYRDFLHLFVGLGVGGGLFLGGRVHRGVSFNAGEAGHAVLELAGANGASEARTLESFASLDALRRRVGAASAAELSARFEANDDALLDWLERAARRFAQLVTTVDALLDLEAVVLGGFLPGALLERLVERIEARRGELAMPGRPHHAAVLAGRTGPLSAALGAAMLPVYDAFLLAPGSGPAPVGVFSSPPTGSSMRSPKGVVG